MINECNAIKAYIRSDTSEQIDSDLFHNVVQFFSQKREKYA